MEGETTSLFTRAIQEHLELKRKNSQLEVAMPIGRYKSEDPFDNHPLFKTEEQARLEETMDGMESDPTGATFSWPGEDSLVLAGAAAVEEDSGLWTRSRDFDWGD